MSYDLKSLTVREFNDAPSLIQKLYGFVLSGRPAGEDMYEQALKEHPEYFPEDIAHRHKWNLVPEEVHQRYFKQYCDIHDHIWQEEPERPNGIIAVLKHDNREVYLTWSEWTKKANTRLAEAEKKLFNKLFNKYGLSK